MLDVRPELQADLLDLLLQAQLRLAEVSLGDEIRQVGVRLLQALKGLGDYPCAGAIIGGRCEGFVEGDTGGQEITMPRGPQWGKGRADAGRKGAARVGRNAMAVPPSWKATAAPPLCEMP